MVEQRSRGRQARWITTGLVMATLVSSVISSFGAPLIPVIAEEFGVSVASAHWSLTVALLAGMVSTPVLGRLGDGPRRRAALLTGLVVVACGGMLAATAAGLAMHLAGRALQGVGLGLAPLTMAIAKRELPTARASSAIALLSVTSVAGLAVGYPASGLMTDAWGLRGAYWFAAAVAVLACAGAALTIPTSCEPATATPFDRVGVALFTPALAVILLAISEGSRWGWTSLTTLGLGLVGGALVAIWVVHQLRSPHPLVQLRLLRHPAVRAADTCALALAVAMYVMLTGVTELAQAPADVGFGASAATAGLVLIPLAVLMVLSSRLLPRVVQRFSIGVVLSGGCLVAAAGCASFAVIHDSLGPALVAMGIIGIGLGVTFAAIPSLIAQSVPATETGSAIGFYQVLRFAGFALGTALIAAILTAHPTATSQPSETGYVTAFWTATGLCLIAAALPAITSASSQTQP